MSYANIYENIYIEIRMKHFDAEPANIFPLSVYNKEKLSIRRSIRRLIIWLSLLLFSESHVAFVVFRSINAT